MSLIVPSEASKVYQDFISMKFTLSQESPVWNSFLFPITLSFADQLNRLDKVKRCVPKNNMRTAYQSEKN